MIVSRELIETVMRRVCDGKNCGCTPQAIDELTRALEASCEAAVTRRVIGQLELRK